MWRGGGDSAAEHGQRADCRIISRVVPVRHVLEPHPQGLHHLRRSAEVATCGVVAPEGAEGRVQLHTWLISDELQASFEFGGGLRAGVAGRRRGQEPALQANGHLAMITRRTWCESLDILEGAGEVVARFAERTALPGIG